MKYITPEMEIVEWKIEDVIRTSDGLTDQGNSTPTNGNSSDLSDW